MIKAVLYDLDGVLVSACDWHAKAFSKALKEISNTEISEEEHVNMFNGLPTKIKLQKLTELGRIKLEDHQLIFDKKQQYTKDTIQELASIDLIKRKLHQYNRWNHLKSVCVTNSITETAHLMLDCTGQLEYLDFVISNELVRYPKPHGEGYIKAMVKLGVYPEECIIVEDSPVGLEAAKSTGAYIWEVKNSSEVNLENFQKFIYDLNSGK